MVDRATFDHLSPGTRRRLARSPYAPLGDEMLRTDTLGRLLFDRLRALGPMTESEAVDALEVRAPGRSQDVITWATWAGLIRRTNDTPARLEAAGGVTRIAAA